MKSPFVSDLRPDQIVNGTFLVQHKDVRQKKSGDIYISLTLADRTGEPEIRKFVSVLTQTDRFGTSMAVALRTHSEYMRIERRQQAEERAAKIGVKLVFPIFFFILPSMLLVTVGPGMLGLFKHLFPMMQQFANQ